MSPLLHQDGTEVGAAMTSTADTTPAQPLKVLLLGLGEVGQGVYLELPRFRGQFIACTIVKYFSNHSASIRISKARVFLSVW